MYSSGFISFTFLMIGIVKLESSGFQHLAVLYAASHLHGSRNCVQFGAEERRVSMDMSHLLSLFDPLRPGLVNVSLFQLEKSALAECIVNHYHHFTSTIPTFCQEFQLQGPACVGSDRDWVAAWHVKLEHIFSINRSQKERKQMIFSKGRICSSPTPNPLM